MAVPHCSLGANSGCKCCHRGNTGQRSDLEKKDDFCLGFTAGQQRLSVAYLDPGSLAEGSREVTTKNIKRRQMWKAEQSTKNTRNAMNQRPREQCIASSRSKLYYLA